MYEMEEDGFKLVSRRRGRHQGGVSRPSQSVTAEPAPEHIDVEATRDRIMKCREHLIGNAYFKQIKDSADLVMHQYQARTEIETLELVCYGVGKISSSLTAKYQLAFLQHLRDLIQKAMPIKCFLYDPVLCSKEIDIIQGLGIQIIHENEEGKRGVDGGSVFYMPHCGKALYNNLLWANWSPTQLSNMVVIGNSFSLVQESMPDRDLQEKYEYLHKMMPHVTEQKLENCFEYSDIFNNTALHYFELFKLSSLPSDFWERKPAPRYEDDVEIIQST